MTRLWRGTAANLGRGLEFAIGVAYFLLCDGNAEGMKNDAKPTVQAKLAIV